MTAPAMTPSPAPGLTWTRQKRTFTRICAHCGQPYPTSSDRSHFCSGKCRQAAYRARRDRKGGGDGKQ